MNAMEEKDIRELLTRAVEPSLSMYMTMQPPSGATKQNFRNFFNSLKCMESELLERGYTTPWVADFLSPAYALLDDNAFWNDQRQTLAYFLSNAGPQYWKIDEAITPQLYVDACFHVRPLLPLVARNRRFYLLALSQRNVRLWLGDAAGLNEIPLPDLAYQQPHLPGREGSQHHTSQPAYRNRQGTSFHGHGGMPDTHKEELLAFCRMVDQAVAPKLTERIPLFVATVGYLFPIYERVNSYPLLQTPMIEGNPEHVPPTELHTRVRAQLAERPPVWASDLDRYAKRTGSGQTSDCLHDVVPAAEHGLIEVLFVVEDEHRWGHLEADTGRVYFDAEGRSGAADLFEEAVAAVLRHGGRVHVLDHNAMPTSEPIAALYRYPLPAGQPA